MIELDEDAFRRLYAAVALFAARRTRTEDREQAAFNRDRARNATQEAFARYVRHRPAHLETFDDVVRYLTWTVRSVLSNQERAGKVRMAAEDGAAIESGLLGRDRGHSAEVLFLEGEDAARRRDRAARIVRQVRDALADDPIALGTVDCIERGTTAPADQVRELGASIDEVHAARKRRKRAVARAIEAVDAAIREENA